MRYWILLFLFPNSSLDAKSPAELIFDTDITGDTSVGLPTSPLIKGKEIAIS